MTAELARRAWTLLLCAAVVVAAVPRIAVADPGTGTGGTAMRAAKKHFDRGEKLFALGKFDAALDEYQRAFDAKPIPAFLFNIGQCYRNLGDFEQAIFSFQKFLKLEPTAPNRSAVEALIDDLQAKQQKLADDRAAATPPPPPPVVVTQPAQRDLIVAPPPVGTRDPSTNHPIYTRWWFWTAIATVALVGGGATYYELGRGSAPATELGNIVFGK